MMYNNKLVAVVKAKGRVLRETNGTVHIPFGTEYSIQIKNLHTEKAVVSIDIDGDNVTDGSRYIIEPNDTVEIEGFLKGNDITRKFKFIEKTQEISDFRGDEMEDGLVKLTYQFEYKWPEPRMIHYSDPTVWYSNDRVIGSNGSGDRDALKSHTTNINYCSNSFTASCDISQSRDLSNVEVNCCADINDAGITGKGSKSNQSFSNGWVGKLEQDVHTMVIQLKGGVKKAIYVQTKLQCDMCGRKWPSKNEYCGSCGHALRD